MADILISQLPKTEAAGDADLLIIDSFDAATGGIVTNAIKWSDLYTKISSFPQGIKFPDGTPLQPSITFVNDTNTGFYRQGEDTIGLSTNGLTRVIVNGSGNVGINTLNPEQKLHVQEGDITVKYGTTNQLLIGARDGGMSVRQTKALPLTIATNDLTRMTISSDGRVLIGTSDLDSNSMLRVDGVIQAGTGTLGSDAGVTTIGANTNTTTDLVYFTTDGAIGNKSKNYGVNGQVLTSAGPGQPWFWGAGGGGGGGGGITLKGEINVTLPAPTADVGDFYLNNTAGNAHPSFNVTIFANVGAFVTFTESGWVIQNSSITNVVDLVSDQTIDGQKTFLEEIIGTAQNCSREVEAGNGLIGGGVLTSDISLTVNAGDGLELSADKVVVKAADNTINVDAGGISVDVSEIFSDDPAVASGVTSFNNRKGAVLPADNDYALDQMSDVTTSGATEGQVLTRQGSQWVAKDISVEGALSFMGEINATIVTAPSATPGQFWVQTGADGTVLADASWGILQNEPVIEGDMIAKSPDLDGQPPQWAIIGNLGGGGTGGVQSISAQNGVTNAGTNENVVLEADNTVVRTSGVQTIGGVKTFSDGIISDVTGDLTGQALDCSRSINAGEGLSGGGLLNANVTLNVSYDTSLDIVADELSVLSGPGLKNGSDGLSGPLQVDTDWLDANYTPAVSAGDGAIALVASPGGGLGVSGSNATANQSGNTEWQISCDATVVRTSDDYFASANLALLTELP